MGIISYAQNFEDVMLWRALKHVEHGFYIDIGAWSPDIDSVTRSFYEHGWTGINIEPNSEFHAQLQDRRPLDKNLLLAIANHAGVLTMNFLGDLGLSTLDDKIAAKHQEAGYSLDRQEEVQVTTLQSLWNLHVPVGQDVHFLKVDVEGLEEAVLRSNNWTTNRPWILVVEATLPMSPMESHEAWEPILLAENYLFTYADGLNRFYVATERAELRTAFKYPPNVFDDFTSNRICLAENRAAQAENRAAQAENRAAQAEHQLADILNSKTWQLTLPIRWAIRSFRSIQRRFFKAANT
jgi:FkbM family methyltransferase